MRLTPPVDFARRTHRRHGEARGEILNTPGLAKRRSPLRVFGAKVDMTKDQTLTALLERLKRFGTLIEIDWGEDDDLWNVVWITGDERIMASAPKLEDALSKAWVDGAVGRARK